ncbi:hypothetical protein CPCC7001_1362 [Cyanobium sp. PCC 7001]|uniref:DUF938 domain-containing protein n=1 Tax=Cyanobium sp. PCC 7001 TaxID=180281 RepID=UPI0001805144|nr:DUF938 domain-containing protein [Cyanobium sp. PCC 7001]EDY38483.1 hypothetical protein CPCC7001_1362 [Cyanobium sp. PCC 7001]
MLFSPACERNREPILAVLRQWLPAGSPPAGITVLEVGSGSGQHGVFFTQQLPGLTWQPSDQAAGLDPLQERIALEGALRPAPGSRLLPALTLSVDDDHAWPAGPYDAVFSANTAHIMAETAVAALIAGSARVLGPGGLLLLYGPFCDNGVHTAESNAAFDAHLRSLDPAMGVRDTVDLHGLAGEHGLESRADVAMPANNRILIWERRG